MVERQFVNSHGQSEVAFAVCFLLGLVRTPDTQDLVALSPLLTQHINLCGWFELDLGARLELEA